MSTDLFIQSKIREDIDLFNKIHAFNILPSGYIHPSWLDETNVLTPELARLLPASRRAHQWLSKWIIARMCPGYFYDFGSPGLRLALLDARVLNKLMTFAGLAIISERLKHTVQGERIRQLKRSLGDDAHDFALKRAPLLIGGLQPPETRTGDIREFDEQAIYSGRFLLENYFGGQAKPLTDRLRLKFSKSIHWNFSSLSGEETRQACWRLMHKILITEIGPPWTTFFT